MVLTNGDVVVMNGVVVLESGRVVVNGSTEVVTKNSEVVAAGVVVSAKINVQISYSYLYRRPSCRRIPP